MESASALRDADRAQRRARVPRPGWRTRARARLPRPAPPSSPPRAWWPLPWPPPPPSAPGRAAVRRCRWDAWSLRAPLRPPRLRAALRRAPHRWSATLVSRFVGVAAATTTGVGSPAMRRRWPSYSRSGSLSEFIVSSCPSGTCTRAAMSLQRIAAANHVEILGRRARGGGVLRRRRDAAATARAAAPAGAPMTRGNCSGSCRRRPARSCALADIPFISREARGRQAVTRGDGGQGLALAHAMRARRDLAGVQLVGRQARRQQFRGPLAPPCRPAIAGGSRAAPGACPVDRRAPGGIQRAQLLAIEPERALERRQAHVRGHRDFAEFLLRPALELAEVLLRVLVDGQRREERREEIARREAERAAVVGAIDLHEIVGADRFPGAPHAGGAVVVRGERQRPAAEHAVVIGQQLRRGFGGAIRIEALVDGVVDAHVATAGGAHELPQARGAHLRIGRGVERRLDVRQHGELGRQSLVGEGLGDVRLPSSKSGSVLP